MKRKHKTDDVCDLGGARSLVSGDVTGNRLPKHTAAKCYLFPQPIRVLFEEQGKSDHSEEEFCLQSSLMFVTPQTSSR